MRKEIVDAIESPEFNELTDRSVTFVQETREGINGKALRNEVCDLRCELEEEGNDIVLADEGIGDGRNAIDEIAKLLESVRQFVLFALAVKVAH
jgi:predicted transcriptional regulator YheO